jgi:hypothetical protein
MEYFVRDFRSETLEGPFPFVHADRYARDFSSENDSGLAELMILDNGNLMIMATYLRGRKRYQGLRSRQAALYNLPPTL